MKSVVILAGISLAILLCGCATSGTKMEQSRVNEIQKGVTTRSEVEAKLGPPDQVVMGPDGRRTLYYSHTEVSAKAANFIPVVNLFTSGANTRRQQLQVLVDKNDVVQDYEFTDRTGDMTGGPFGYTKEAPTPPETK